MTTRDGQSGPADDYPRDCGAESLDVLHRQMVRDAENGHWSGFPDLLAQRDLLLQGLADETRVAGVEAALACNAMVLQCAERDRNAAADRLHAIANKNALNRYYESNGGIG